MKNVTTTMSTQTHTDEYLVRADDGTVATKCPECGHDKLYAFGHRAVRYVDLRLHGNRTLISLNRQRFQCRKCGVTFFGLNPEFDAEFRLTTRCVKWVEQESIFKPFTQIARHLGIDEHVVRNVFRRYAHSREKELKPQAGRVIGIDELYLLSQFRCIITNLERKTVIDLLPQRRYPPVAAYLKQLQGADKIEVVCMDMWEPYKDAVHAVLPKARIVVDKFHVTKWANECMDRIRKAHQSTLATGFRRDMMRSRFILLHRRQDLKDEHLEKLARWRKSSPDLADAYDFKEKFFDIYNHRDPKDAKAAYDAWVNSLPLSISKAFKPLLTAVKNWETEIFTYFDSRYTNAYTECLNGIVKLANRTGRGYSFDVIRFKLLFGHDRRKFKPATIRSWYNGAGIPFSTFDERFYEDE